MNYSCKRVINCTDLKVMEEEDIVRELAVQDVTDARFITRFTEGVWNKTATIILTYGKVALSSQVTVGYGILNVRP